MQVVDYEVEVRFKGFGKLWVVGAHVGANLFVFFGTAHDKDSVLFFGEYQKNNAARSIWGCDWDFGELGVGDFLRVFEVLAESLKCFLGGFYYRCSRKKRFSVGYLVGEDEVHIRLR